MNIKLWMNKNKEGSTPLHDMASNKQLDRLPKELFCSKYFLAADKLGVTPLHLAMQPGQIQYIPRELMLGRSFMRLIPNIIQTGIPANNMLYPDRYRTTPLHKAAENGCLQELPKECILSHHMMVKDVVGYTPMHNAMLNNFDIPAECFSKKSLTVKNHLVGVTPLDMLIERIKITELSLRPLLSIPELFQTQEYFLTPGILETSLMHTLAAVGLLKNVPKHLITLENIVLPDKDGKSVLDVMHASDLPEICHLELPITVINEIGKEKYEGALKIFNDKKDLLKTTNTPIEIELF